MYGSLIWLALLSAPASQETGVSLLAEQITDAIERRFPVHTGSIKGFLDDQVIIDTPKLPPGLRMQWLVSDESITDPETLLAIGTSYRSCGLLEIVSSDETGSIAVVSVTDGCPPPRLDQRVEVIDKTIHLAIETGAAAPALHGLLELMTAILPDRLARNGRFQLEGPHAGWTRRATSAVLERRLAASELDAIAVLSLAARGPRLHALVEIRSGTAYMHHDVAQISVPVVPEMLWRNSAEQPHSPYGFATAEFEDGVLALASGHEDPGQLFVLTRRALVLVELDASGELTRTTLSRFDQLPHADVVTRVDAGSVVVDSDAGRQRVCFSSTALSDGWCLSDDVPERLPGVPLEGQNGLLLAEYVPGTDLLSGQLRDRGGQVIGDIGTFLALTPDTSTGYIVQRPSGQLEELSSEFKILATISVLSGDAWALRNDGARIETAALEIGAPDELRWYQSEMTKTVPIAGGGIVALTVVDIDRNGNGELAIATVSIGGATRLTLLQP